MNSNFKRFISFILCLLISLSTVSCGKALSHFNDKEINNEEGTDEYEAKWSIYIYMVGSDLEDRELDQLSKLTSTVIEEEAKAEDENYNKLVSDRVKAFTEEVSDMGMTLPNALYNKSKPEEEKEKNTDEDAMGYATYSLEMLINSDIPEGVQFIIQTGGAKRWQSSLVNPNRSQRFLVDCNGICEIYNEPCVNMANPDTLEEFMVYCKEYFPAEHEMMLFWDHGGAYSGFGIDNMYGTDMLTVREMVSTFQNVQKLYSENESLFDVIAFDACVMGNLETMRLFAPYADYYFASAEEMSGLGWGYDRIIEAMYDNPDISPYDLGVEVAKANVANVQIEDYEGIYPATYSIYDLTKIENVYRAYIAFVKKLLCDTAKDITALTNVSREARNTLSYCYGNSGGFNLLDLGDFAEKISPLYGEYAENILSALDECVLYHEATTYFKGCKGMSIFFPSEMVGLISLRKYLMYTNDLSDSPDIDALYYYKVTGCLNDKLRNYCTEMGYGDFDNIDFYEMTYIPYLDAEIEDNGNFSIQLTEEMQKITQRASYGLAYLDEETSDIAYFGEFKSLEIASDGTISTDFDLTMPSIEGNELPVETINEDSEVITYRVPIYYYDIDCYLIFTLDKATREYTICGITLDNDNGTGDASREVIELEDGDELAVKYKYGNLYSVVEDEACFDFVYSSDLKIVDKTLSDGYYYAYIRVDDLRSDVYYSPTVLLTVEDGEVTSAEVDYSINASDTSEKQ